MGNEAEGMTMIFQEIKGIMGIDIQRSPMIVLLNMFGNIQLGIILTVERLIPAKNWKNNNQFNMDEMWNMAINDELMCELKVTKGILKTNCFKERWDAFFKICI